MAEFVWAYISLAILLLDSFLVEELLLAQPIFFAPIYDKKSSVDHKAKFLPWQKVLLTS